MKRYVLLAVSSLICFNLFAQNNTEKMSGAFPVSITEIFYNSDNYNESNDWVEIHNYSGNPVDISNWQIRDETPFNFYTIPPGTILEPDEYLVLVQDVDTFLMIHPGVTNYVGPYFWGMNNTFGSVKLLDSGGDIVRQVNYIDSIPWPKAADGLGPGLQIIDELASENNPANWMASCVLGSPGVEYTPCNYDILMSEINYNSSTAYNPGDWVEILNRGGSAKDISGWIMRDGNIDNIYVIPNGSILEPGERLVISDSLVSFTEKFPTVSNVVGEPTFHFSNGGDCARLYDGTGRIKYSVRFNDSAPWPEDADGDGFTLELIDEPGNPNIASSWIAGCLYGSPGKQLIIPCPNAIEDFEPALFTVSPNPFGENIQIQIISGKQLQEIFITNNLGQRIISLHAESNNITWNGRDRNGLEVSNGNYLVTAIDENGKISSVMLVKVDY